jgi:hypothetical protein
MALLATGIALTALLLASYTTRYAWAACGSLALSIVALIGVAFLSTTKDPQAQDRLVWLASQLAPVLDRKALDGLTAAIRRVSTSLDDDVRRRAAAVSPRRQAIQAATIADWPKVKPPPKAKWERKATPGDPVYWLLDKPSIQSAADIGHGFRIRGINVSSQTLKDVQGTLKPDASQRRRGLTLNVEGRLLKDEAVIPPGARFSLASDVPKTGGAILTFRYSYAGQQRTTILYLTAPTVSRLR